MSKRREDGRLGQRFRPQHGGGGACPTRKVPGGKAKVGTVGVAEGTPLELSAPSRRAEIGSVNDSSNSSTSNDSSDSKYYSTMRGGQRQQRQPHQQWQQQYKRQRQQRGHSRSHRDGGEAPVAFRQAPRTPERTHKVPITGLDFE